MRYLTHTAFGSLFECSDDDGSKFKSVLSSALDYISRDIATRGE